MAWNHVPVKALNEHEYWSTVGMLKSITPKGDEIRVYFNTTGVYHLKLCSKGNTVDKACAIKHHPCTTKEGIVSEKELQAFITCSDERAAGCNNIFFIENGYVTRYVPVGSCTTNSTIIPDKKLDLKLR